MQRGFVQDVCGLFTIERYDHSVKMPLGINTMCEGPEGELAAGAEGAQHGAFGDDSIFSIGTVESADGGENGGVAGGVFGVERMLGVAGFESERSLAGCGSDFIHGKTLVRMRGAFEAVKTGGG